MAARGAWVWILGNIRNLDGQRTLTLDGWARLIGASPNQTVTVLEELINTRTCDAIVDCHGNVTEYTSRSVTKCHIDGDAIVTLVNRRIAREAKARKAAMLRQQRHRAQNALSRESNAAVTPIEAEAEALPLNPPDDVTPGNGNNGHRALTAESMFLILWESYPPNRRSKKIEAEFEFKKLRPDRKLFSHILSAVDVLKQSEEWTRQDGRYVPGLLKWIQARGWEAVPAEETNHCKTCNRIGVVVHDSDKILPWSLPREVNQGLKPEVCPECGGKDRVNTPGLPDLEFEV